MIWPGWYGDIRRRYAPNERRAYEYPINRYYAHRIDPILTWLADCAGISPNVATILSLSAGVAAASAVLGGQYLAAALLIQLHHLLDGVDGNLARTHDRCTEFGKRLDSFSDFTVRLLLFTSLAYAADTSSSLAWGMLATLAIDLAVVHFVILPFARCHTLVRDRWKQWFMDRGLMPAFDIFTIYFIISVCLLFGSPEAAVALTAVMKTVDWSYRLYECLRTRLSD